MSFGMRRELERDVLISSCAISAGVHGALVREHFAEGPGPGGGFLASAAVLIALAVALTRSADTFRVLVGAAVLGGLIVAYGFATTTGIPVLHPEVEHVDRLALFTEGVEALGLAAAVSLLVRPTSLPALHHDQRRTT